MSATATKLTKLQQIKESVYQKLIAEFGEIPAAVEDNYYEERLEERRERYEKKAANASQRSTAAYQASHAATQHIPLGQPILVGHHSEKRHRAALKRSDNGMRKSITEQRKSEYYAGRAAAVGSAGIDSTDPDAIRKLMLKLLNLQITQEIKKAANKIIKSKAKKYPSKASKYPALAELGIKEMEAKGLFEPDFCGRIGFPAYELSNNNGNMRRIKERIKSLASLSAIEDKTYTLFDDWLTVEINKVEGRVFLSNPSKPSDEVRAIYRRNGYNWSGRNEAWTRKLTDSAIGSIEWVKRALTELGEENF